MKLICTCLTQNLNASGISWREQVTFTEMIMSQPVFMLTMQCCGIWGVILITNLISTLKVSSVCRYVVTLVRSSTILPVVREIIRIKNKKDNNCRIKSGKIYYRLAHYHFSECNLFSPWYTRSIKILRQTTITHSFIPSKRRGRHGRDRMVFGFTTTYTISA
jgi:hypothetical protein